MGTDLLLSYLLEVSIYSHFLEVSTYSKARRRETRLSNFSLICKKYDWMF